MTANKNHKETFGGYSLYIPRDIIEKEEKNPLLTPLMPLETGLFEKASKHDISRSSINEYVLLYCIDGLGYLETANYKHKISSGAMVICLEKTAHRYWADSQYPWSIYWLHFKGIAVTSLLEELNLTSENPIIHLGIKGELIQTFLKISQILRKGYGFPHIYQAVSLTHYLFSQIILLNNYSPNAKGYNLDMENVLDFLSGNVDKSLTLDEIAKEMGISKYHFSRRFKQVSGFSPMVYFNQLKIQRACELLDTTQLSIKEISALLSFNTPYYFSETFKRITGLSPEFYRKGRKKSY